MYIKISDKYVFKTDKYNWIISEAKFNEEDELYWENVGYYSDIEMAVKGLVKKQIMSLEAHTFAEAIKGVEDIHRELVRALMPKYKVTKVE